MVSSTEPIPNLSWIIQLPWIVFINPVFPGLNTPTPIYKTPSHLTHPETRPKTQNSRARTQSRKSKPQPRPKTQTFFQEGLLRQKNQLDAYVAWHRRQGLAPSLDEMMSLPSSNERWAQDGQNGGLPGAPKVTVILNLFKREVRLWKGSCTCNPSESHK